MLKHFCICENEKRSNAATFSFFRLFVDAAFLLSFRNISFFSYECNFINDLLDYAVKANYIKIQCVVKRLACNNYGVNCIQRAG